MLKMSCKLTAVAYCEEYFTCMNALFYTAHYRFNGKP